MSTSLITSAILLATFFAYRGALDHGFVYWDTQHYVIENEHIRSLSWPNLAWMFTQSRVGMWHPLTWLSHAADHAVYGLDPSGHHLTNVVLHCLNSALVFALTYLLLSVIRLARTRRLIAAGIAGLFFGIHPQHVESVAWVAERKDVLCQLFSLSSLISYVIYAGTPPEERVKRSSRYAVALLSFCLALLSKPMAVTIPLVLLILDVFPLKRIELSRGFRLITPLPSCWKVALEKLPFFALAGIAVLLAVWAQGVSKAILPTAIISMQLRFFNAASAVIFYLMKLVIPVDLSPSYPILPLPGVQEGPLLLVPLLAIVGVTLVAIREWRRGREAWLACWTIFLVTLSPVVGIVQVGTQGAADRYTYLPTLPFLMLLGCGIAGLPALAPGRLQETLRIGIGLACALVAAGLFFLTQRQVEIWQDDNSLWSHAARIYPDDFGIQMSLGVARSRDGRHREALEAYQHALEIGDSAAVIRRYQRSELVSPYGRLYQRIAEAYMTLGRYQEALAIYDHALRHDILLPLSRPAIYYNMAGLCVRLEQHDEAMAMVREALRLDPRHARAKALLVELQARERSSP